MLLVDASMTNWSWGGTQVRTDLAGYRSIVLEHARNKAAALLILERGSSLVYRLEHVLLYPQCTPVTWVFCAGSACALLVFTCRRMHSQRLCNHGPILPPQLYTKMKAKRTAEQGVSQWSRHIHDHLCPVPCARCPVACGM